MDAADVIQQANHMWPVGMQGHRIEFVVSGHGRNMHRALAVRAKQRLSIRGNDREPEATFFIHTLQEVELQWTL